MMSFSSLCLSSKNAKGKTKCKESPYSFYQSNNLLSFLAGQAKHLISTHQTLITRPSARIPIELYRPITLYHTLSLSNT